MIKKVTTKLAQWFSASLPAEPRTGRAQRGLAVLSTLMLVSCSGMIATERTEAPAPVASTVAPAPGARASLASDSVRLRGVLGGVPLSPRDSVVKSLVDRLDLESYKELLRGLTQFGDRRQGTERNAQALAWIEGRLRTWGYEPVRLDYDLLSFGAASSQPREELFATKVGVEVPEEMYILGAHMDGIGEGEAANDDGSGTALLLEIARVLAGSDIEMARSVRFAFWNNEETGLQGSSSYVEQRAALQGVEDPPGSGRYPEPRWLGMIQHDMMMWDHGNPVTHDQALDADVDVEFQLNSTMAGESARLGLALINANRKYADEYPAVLSNAMSNTDSAPFQDLTAAVSLRENRRLYETGNGANPHWHQPTDLFVTFSDADFRLGLNAAMTTLGAIAELAGVRIAPGG